MASGKGKKVSAAYTHADEALLRPDVGTQAQFKKKKRPKTYSYDSSLSPALDWDAQHRARELGEWLLSQLAEAATLEPPHRFPESRSFHGVEVSGLQDAVDRLTALGMPFLDWAGKAERLSFDVPTLPLFVHERLSTKAILETLGGHERDRQMELQLYGDPQLPLHERLDAYEHTGEWVNRLILGDSLVVMNSLLEYEGLGAQVQMIYIDPPYGVQFFSNFQPFVRRRNVKDKSDDDMTREPEMVKAYRDTWELGLHSYLTYLRDRLLLSRELLTPSGSVFVQISEDNLHHVREICDEVFGSENFVTVIAFTKTTGLEAADRPASRLDYLVWYARDIDRVKYRALFEEKDAIEAGFTQIELPDGTRRRLTKGERAGHEPLPEGARLFMAGDLTKPGPGARYEVEVDGETYTAGNRWWGMPKESLEHLIGINRTIVVGKTLRYVRYYDDFSLQALSNLWDGVAGAPNPLYVVQTNTTVIERCLLMTTEPGDLVLDPTCGSGTTAYVAEQWGRRWITADTSRVPLVLARQRLLTATFPYYMLENESMGPAGGFAFSRKQSRSGKQVGGIVSHVTPASLGGCRTNPRFSVRARRENGPCPRTSSPVTVTNRFYCRRTCATGCLRTTSPGL